MGGARTYYSFELFMEIRKEGQVFKKYRKGGACDNALYMCSVWG